MRWHRLHEKGNEGIRHGIRRGNLWANGQFSRINFRFERESGSGSSGSNNKRGNLSYQICKFHPSFASSVQR